MSVLKTLLVLTQVDQSYLSLKNHLEKKDYTLIPVTTFGVLGHLLEEQTHQAILVDLDNETSRIFYDSILKKPYALSIAYGVKQNYDNLDEFKLLVNPFNSKSVDTLDNLIRQNSNDSSKNE